MRIADWSSPHIVTKLLRISGIEMFKNIFLLIIVYASPLLSQSDSVIVEVTGSGPTVWTARSDAIRQALSSAVSQLVIADRKIAGDEIIRDDVASTLNGFIRRFTAIETRKEGNEWIVKATVVVGTSQIMGFISSSNSTRSSSIDGVSMLAAVKQIEEKEIANERLIASLFDGYPFSVVNVSLDSIISDPNTASVRVTYTLSNDDGFIKYLVDLGKAVTPSELMVKWANLRQPDMRFCSLGCVPDDSLLLDFRDVRVVVLDYPSAEWPDNYDMRNCNIVPFPFFKCSRAQYVKQPELWERPSDCPKPRRGADPIPPGLPSHCKSQMYVRPPVPEYRDGIIALTPYKYMPEIRDFDLRVILRTNLRALEFGACTRPVWRSRAAEGLTVAVSAGGHRCTLSIPTKFFDDAVSVSIELAKPSEFNQSSRDFFYADSVVWVTDPSTLSSRERDELATTQGLHNGWMRSSIADEAWATRGDGLTSAWHRSGSPWLRLWIEGTVRVGSSEDVDSLIVDFLSAIDRPSSSIPRSPSNLEPAIGWRLFGGDSASNWTPSQDFVRRRSPPLGGSIDALFAGNLSCGSKDSAREVWFALKAGRDKSGQPFERRSLIGERWPDVPAPDMNVQEVLACFVRRNPTVFISRLSSVSGGKQRIAIGIANPSMYTAQISELYGGPRTRR